MRQLKGHPTSSVVVAPPLDFRAKEIQSRSYRGSVLDEFRKTAQGLVLLQAAETQWADSSSVTTVLSTVDSYYDSMKSIIEARDKVLRSPLNPTRFVVSVLF